MAEAEHPKRHVLSRGARIAVRIGVSGVVLGLLVVGVGALVAPRAPAPVPKSVPVTRAPDPGASDYAAALSALASGDTTGAATLLARAAAAGNTAASAKLAEISKNGTSTPSTTTVTSTDPYTQPVRDMASLLPTAVAGYTAGFVETSTASALLPLEPTVEGPAGTVRLAVLNVLDKGTVASARAYVTEFTRSYAKDLKAVTIGTVAGRFGTDGSHLAAVTFSRGRYAFEVVVTVTRGAPRALEPVTLQLAQALAAKQIAP